MLTQAQLQAMLSDMESDRIERTTATNHTDKFAQAVCAFANDYPNHRKPGYLLIGVDDNGMPSGLKVTDPLLQNLGALRSDGNILPLPALSVARFQCTHGQVAVVEVRNRLICHRYAIRGKCGCALARERPLPVSRKNGFSWSGVLPMRAALTQPPCPMP